MGALRDALMATRGWLTAFNQRQALHAADALERVGLPARGATFPTSPRLYDLFFRTDRGILYYYDGTRWLTVHEYVATIPRWTGIPATAIAVTTQVGQLPVPDVPGGGSIYLTGWEFAFFLNGANDAVDHWIIGLGTQPGVSLSSENTGTPVDYAGSTWHRIVKTMAGIRVPATDIYWHVTATRVAAAGTINVSQGVVRYRGIG